MGSSNALWEHAWHRKSVNDARSEAKSNDSKRVLGLWQLTLSGMGFVLGSGIFVLTGTIAAKYAGPAACLTFVMAAIPAALAALCYAEMVTLVPGAGGAYRYVSVGLGELPGFWTGWMLSLTYTGGCSLVGSGWAAYVGRTVEETLGHHLPAEWTSAPWRWDAATHSLQATGGYVNLLAAGIILTMAAVMLLGARESVGFTAFLVMLKLAVIALVIVYGAPHVEPELWIPFLPENRGEFGHLGPSGLIQGAGVAMFAYLGVDNICIAAQDAREPQRNIPRAIAICLSICTLLYIAVSLILTGLVRYTELGVEDPIAVGVQALHAIWLMRAVQAGSIVGLTSVLLMQMYGLPRIVQTMAHDGLAPRWMGETEGKSATPKRGVMLMAAIAATGAALLPVEMLGGLAANGTMLTFIAVSLSVLLLRRSNPKTDRPFAVPFGPVIPLASTITCAALIVTAPIPVLASLAGWLGLGTVAYAIARRR